MKKISGSLGWVLLLGLCLLAQSCGQGEPEPAPAESPGGGTIPAVEPEPMRPETAPAPPPAATRPARPALTTALLEELAGQGVHLDLTKKQIRLDGEVCLLNANLEYVLVGKRGARHEALFVANVKPSALNAALLALGLEPGKNFEVRERVPAPSEEDVLSGKELPYELLHPSGPGVYLTVEWAGEGEKVVRHRVEELVLNLNDNEPLEPRTWIYFGGREAPLYRGEPPVFLADFEENLISVCYMSPSNHLITIVHDRGLNQGLWWPNADLLPERGTAVRFFISLEPLP